MSPELYRDRYEPVALAGRGAQGEVWLARDHVHDRPVALKIRDTVGIDRDALLGEARTLLAMRPHDGLPLVRDDFFTGDPATGSERYVVTMDWIEGRNLASTRDLSFEEILGHLRAVAEALDHLHTHVPPIVHRDVKPQNVVLSDNGRTVLVDFGLAGATAGPRYLDGTPGYLAPEVAAGGAATPASDVFALAVTAFVAITGDLPTPGRTPDWSLVPEAWREHVHRALADGLAFDPAHRPRSAGELVRSMSPADAPNNLPAALSSFVGRAAETMELRRLLSASRLVTLVGTGGSGKTRLALRVADTALSAFPDGAWLTELAGVTEPELVASRVALSLGVRTDGGRDVTEALAEFLTSGTQLLVLDNCEHVVDVVAHLVEALLRACPRLTILATSREPLRAAGEIVWNVAPLADDESVRLFADRAPPGIGEIAEEALVHEVCARLDGIPLAIELAAAQLATMPLDELTTGLDEALSLLTGGARTNPRQETMLATIRWSHDRLTGAEQHALRRLSVFAGGFSGEAAESVASAASSLPRLVETSLVAHDGERFRILEPVRQFAAGELERAGELAASRDEHVRWVRAMVERPELPDAPWVARLASDHDNLEAALAYAMTADPALGGEIVRLAVQYWTQRGYWVQGRSWVRQAIASDAVQGATRAELLLRAGDMARNQGDLVESRELTDAAASLYRELGDARGLAWAVSSQGLVAFALGDPAAARSYHQESIELHRASGDDRGLASALNNLAIVQDAEGDLSGAISALSDAVALLLTADAQLAAAFTRLNLGALHRKAGDTDAARSELHGSLETFTEAGHDWGRSVAMNELAALALKDADVAEARTQSLASLEISRRQNDRTSQAQSLHILGAVAEHEGDLDAAHARHMEGLALHREIGAPFDVATSLDYVAAIDVARGDHVDAVHRFAEAHALRDAAGVPADGDADARAAIEQLKKELGGRFEREWAAGARNPR